MTIYRFRQYAREAGGHEFTPFVMVALALVAAITVAAAVLFPWI